MQPAISNSRITWFYMLEIKYSWKIPPSIPLSDAFDKTCMCVALYNLHVWLLSATTNFIPL